MKYDVIYADPPWSYKAYNKKDGGRTAESHYPTMKLKDICELPVAELANDNATLFLWVTFPCLEEGLKLLKSWGFKYKTLGFCWVKRNRKATDTWFWGLGFWTRSNPEVCIIATKGSPKRDSAGVHSVVDTPIEKHSKKPDEVRHRIEELMGPNVSKIELFAREESDGWTCLGNEINGKDIRDSLREEIERVVL